MNTVTIDSKDQNRINVFMACAYAINDGFEIDRNMAAARLAYYNMSIEAQQIACEMYRSEFGTEWR